MMKLTISGKTYTEKQNNLRNIAIDVQGYITDVGNMSYYELAIIQDFFYRNGKRYGLLREFHENGIC